MAIPAPSRDWTVEDLEGMPDNGYKYELQAGLLLSEPLPGSRHGRMVARIVEVLAPFVRARGLGVVIAADSGFVLRRSPDTVRGPDVAFVTRDRYAAAGDDRRAFEGAPDLAVEVVSPSQSPERLHAKVADYLAAGTRMVWLVDPETRTVVVYRELLAPCTIRAVGTLQGEDVLPGFRVDLLELFED